MPFLENLLGAVALACTDRMDAAFRGSVGNDFPASEAAALLLLRQHPDCTGTWLGAVLGLTSSGATRLVQRLVQFEWADRCASAFDGRSRTLRLTKYGASTAAEMAGLRERTLADVLRGLSSADRADLERLLGIVLKRTVDTRAEVERICRLCEPQVCRSNDGECPLDQTLRTSALREIPA
jgi:DNA-binding MarR family transcriptional regulator